VKRVIAIVGLVLFFLCAFDPVSFALSVRHSWADGDGGED